MKYNVTITEYLSRTYTVEAKDADAAETVIDTMYDEEEIILDEGDFTDKEITVEEADADSEVEVEA